ncbi:hypothetical protein ES706_02429 [subsurface metagenome]
MEKKQLILPIFFSLVTIVFAIYITRNIPPTLDLTKFYHGVGYPMLYFLTLCHSFSI